MKRTYCDICGEEIGASGDSFKLSINRGVGMNTYIANYEDSCDLCRIGIAKAIREFIDGKKQRV